MASNQFSFTGTAYSFGEVLTFESNNTFARTEDDLADVSMTYIDPSLQSSSSPDPYLGHWDFSQQQQQQQQQQQLVVQRYLEDPQKTAFFNADPKATPNRSVMRPTVGVSPHPGPPSHVRFASPISSPGPSSSSDIMHSPPTDTDSHYESFGSPAADPATLQLSFPQPPPPYDPHWTTHAVQFMGMGPTDAYVSLDDISPNPQPAECCENESTNVGFSFPQRGYSFESYTTTSPCDMESVNNTAALDLPVRRLASPGPLQPAVKEEPDASSRYPTLPLRSHDAESEDSDQEPSRLTTPPPPPPPPPKRRKSQDESDSRPNKRKLTRRSPKAALGASPLRSADHQAPKKPKAAQTIASNAPPSPPIPAAKALPLASSSAKSTFSCPDCSHSPFKDQANLESHIKKQHTRPFICVFHFAGCESTFASKNEWKRHVTSQHLLLNYWLCNEGPCAGASSGKSSANGPSALQTSSPSKSSSRSGKSSRSTAAAANSQSHGHSSTTPSGVIFNRKDLYTQHVRRMHMPPQIKKSLKQQQAAQQQSSSTGKKSSSSGNPSTTTTTTTTTTTSSTGHPEWEDRLRAFQSRAIRERCKLPVMMTCPAPGCVEAFHGPESWDKRMEHVARHLEKAAAGKEEPVQFGGPGLDRDTCLVEWASREDVAIIRRKPGGVGDAPGWELNPGIKRGASHPGPGGGHGTPGIVMVQPGRVVASSSSSATVKAATATSKKRKAAAAAAPAVANVRFALVKKEDEDEEEAEIKNEIVVTSEEDDDEIVVDVMADEGLRDADADGEEDDE